MQVHAILCWTYFFASFAAAQLFPKMSISPMSFFASSKVILIFAKAAVRNPHANVNGTARDNVRRLSNGSARGNANSNLRGSARDDSIRSSSYTANGHSNASASGFFNGSVSDSVDGQINGFVR